MGFACSTATSHPARGAFGLAAALAALAVAGSARAAVYTWQGTTGTTTSWADTTKWLDEASAAGAPVAGDLARLHVGVSSNTLINTGSGAGVGSLSARPGFGLYRVRANVTGGGTFTFNNGASESLITVSHSNNSSSFTGLLQFGSDANALALNLAGDLRINNDGARVANGRVDFGGQSTITGGSAGNRRTITVQALGTSAITHIVGGAATFVGDWVVDGAKATLDMNANAFGDSSNGVTLRGGGVLDLDGLGAFAWGRDLAGTGTVKAAGGLTVAGTGVLSPGESVGTLNITTPTLTFGSGGALDIELGSDSLNDLVNVTGAVVLGGTLDVSTLGAYAPSGGNSWTILTATGGVTGNFTNPMPAGFTVDVEGNSVVLNYIAVPEPGSALTLVGLLGLATARRRRVN